MTQEEDAAWLAEQAQYRSPIVHGILFSVPPYDRYNTEYDYHDIYRTLSGINAQRDTSDGRSWRLNLPIAWSTLEYLFQDLHHIPIVDLRLSKPKSGSLGILVQKHSEYHRSQTDHCECSENRTCDLCYRPPTSP